MQLPWKPLPNIACQAHQNKIKKKEKERQREREQLRQIILVVDAYTLVKREEEVNNRTALY